MSNSSAASSSTHGVSEGTTTNPQDCLPCKVIGGTAFLGLGTYTLYSGLSQLREERANLSSAEIAALKFGQRASFLARRMGVWGIGLGLVGAGSYRMFLQ